MGIDEEGALAQIKALRTLFHPKVAEHRTPRGELRDRITVFRKVSPRSTILYRSFYYEWPQAWRAGDAREAAELLEQARARPSERDARLLWPFGSLRRQ
jgi:hypothetical protein